MEQEERNEEELNPDLVDMRDATSTNPVTSKSALSKLGTATIHHGDASSNLLLGSRLQSLDMENADPQNAFIERIESRAYKTYTPCDILFQDGP